MPDLEKWFWECPTQHRGCQFYQISLFEIGIVPFYSTLTLPCPERWSLELSVLECQLTKLRWGTQTSGLVELVDFQDSRNSISQQNKLSCSSLLSSPSPNVPTTGCSSLAGCMLAGEGQTSSGHLRHLPRASHQGSYLSQGCPPSVGGRSTHRASSTAGRPESCPCGTC